MSAPSSPFLSIVIPTYNRRESLQITLDALARQHYPIDQFEVLVVSDGSTDGTEEWLTNYTPPYPFRAITQPNGGPARARNRGIREAVGQVLVFLDDDVEPVPEWLSAHAAHHEALEVDAERCVVIAPMLPDPTLRGKEPCWIAWEHVMLEKQYTAWRTGLWAGCGPNHFYSGNASLRRAHLLSVGGFDENFPRQEDVELAYRLERECDLHFVYEPLARGIHRPHRSFASWLAIPFAYGQLDVIRARRGDSSWDLVRGGYHKRNTLTRLLAQAALAAPLLSLPLRATLLAVARIAYILRRDNLSSAALSAIYNLRYLEGAAQEIGTRAELRNLVLSRPAR